MAWTIGERGWQRRIANFQTSIDPAAPRIEGTLKILISFSKIKFKLLILPKEGQTAGESPQEHLQSTLTGICQNLSPRQEPGASIQQLIIALYLFPTTVIIMEMENLKWLKI